MSTRAAFKGVKTSTNEANVINLFDNESIETVVFESVDKLMLTLKNMPNNSVIAVREIPAGILFNKTEILVPKDKIKQRINKLDFGTRRAKLFQAIRSKLNVNLSSNEDGNQFVLKMDFTLYFKDKEGNITIVPIELNGLQHYYQENIQKFAKQILHDLAKEELSIKTNIQLMVCPMTNKKEVTYAIEKIQKLIKENRA